MFRKCSALYCFGIVVQTNSVFFKNTIYKKIFYTNIPEITQYWVIFEIDEGVIKKIVFFTGQNFFGQQQILGIIIKFIQL